MVLPLDLLQKLSTFGTTPDASTVYFQSYYGIILYLFIAAALSSVLAVVAYLFSLSAAQDSEKRSEYECGFEPFDSATRLPFDVHFYLVGILFLIFDVEIALLFPWALSLRTSGWFGFYLMLGFIVLLAVGFLYEWKRGALIWPSRQSERPYKHGLTKYNGGATAVLLLSAQATEYVAPLTAAESAVCVVAALAVRLAVRTVKSRPAPQAGQHPYSALPTQALEQRMFTAFRRTAFRLKKLALRMRRFKLKKLEACTKNIRFAERRLSLHRQTLTFYVRQIARFAAAERNKNFHNELAVAQYEARSFRIAERAREEYVGAVSAYKEVFKKISRVKAVTRSSKKSKAVSMRKVSMLLRLSRSLLKNHVRVARVPTTTATTRFAKKRKPRRRNTRRAKLSLLLPPAITASADSYFLQFVGDFLPEFWLTVVITAVLALMARDLGQNKPHQHIVFASFRALLSGLAVVAAIYCIQLAFGSATALFNGYILVTTYTTALKLLTVLSGWFILSNSAVYMRAHTRQLLEYPVVLTLSVLFMLLLVGSGHLISAFLALVGFSLNLYVLVLFDSPQAIAREAGIKYFYLSAISSGLILYGIFLFFVVTGTSHVYEIGHFLATNTEIINNSESVLHLGLVLILVGVFFKLSAFPGHLWAADVYEGSPDPVTAFFMLPVKVAVLAFITQLLAVAFEPLISLWQPIVVLSASVSLVWGCFAALAESRTKRFLAYASINQIGFLLMGLASGSTDGYRTVIFYLILYAVMNAGFLVVFLNARRTTDNRGLIYLSDFRGFGHVYAQYSWSVAMILFSMAGIPPLAGFFGKYYLLLHAQEQELYGLVIIGLATSLVSTYYYLRLVKIFWFEGSKNMTYIRCTLSRWQVLALQLAEWSLWVFIVQSGSVLYSVDAVINGLFVLNSVSTF